MIIYTIENKINQCVYVGKTNDLDKSLSNRLYDATRRNRQDSLSKAIRQYGWDCFRLRVITQDGNQELYNKYKLAYQSNSYNKSKE